jgi:hypothetical protein
MTPAELASYRRQPEAKPPLRPPLQPSVLRHSDDQTVAALAAVYAAVRQMGNAEDREFEGWGILVASRFLGRSSLVAALDRFESEGVWGVSPHLIPHYALHSPAGTLSLALGLRGPSLGIGGGLGAGFEGLLAALSWLTAGVVPGLWLVQTAWSPEFVPDERGEPRQESACLALAMALVHSPSWEPAKPALRLVTSRVPGLGPSLGIDELAALLAQVSEHRQTEKLHHSPNQPTTVNHPGPGISAPHFSQNAPARTTVRTIACDAAGRTRVELILPRRHHVREDD